MHGGYEYRIYAYHEEIRGDALLFLFFASEPLGTKTGSSSDINLHRTYCYVTCKTSSLEANHPQKNLTLTLARPKTI